MKKFGLIGFPLGHSFSPRIHNKIYEMNNIEASYSMLEIDPARMQRNTFEELTKDFDGLNITIPFKSEILQYLNVINDEVQQIGAANCIKKVQNKWSGFNTDIYGFLYPLSRYIGNIKSCLVVGTGGAAKAVIYAILKHVKPKQLIIAGRMQEKADIIKNTSKKINESIEIITDNINAVNNNLLSMDMVVNATSIGMYPNINESILHERFKLKEGAIVYDLIYNPMETRLLQQAKLNNPGCVAINGLEMLIAQAVKAVELWTEKTISVKTTIEALDISVLKV